MTFVSCQHVLLRKPKRTRIADSDGVNFVGEKHTSTEYNVENILLGNNDTDLKEKLHERNTKSKCVKQRSHNTAMCNSN